MMIANVLLEGREHMRLDLGPEIEKALANDAQESVEAAATPASRETAQRVLHQRNRGDPLRIGVALTVLVLSFLAVWALFSGKDFGSRRSADEEYLEKV